MATKKEIDVLGGTLETCSLRPLTGFLRDGDCRLGLNDYGRHGVCAQVTDSFLEFTKNRENDLSAPLPMANFPGLRPGDRWWPGCPTASPPKAIGDLKLGSIRR